LEKTAQENDFFSLEPKRKIWFIIFAPIALYWIDNELCLLWMVGSLFGCMVLKTYANIGKIGLITIAYASSVVLVLLAILIHYIKNRNRKS
jgi:hypothetical protein